MAFKMKGFPLRSAFKHTEGKHEDHHGGVANVAKNVIEGMQDEEVVDPGAEGSNKDPFTPVIEDDAYKNAKLKRAMERYKLDMRMWENQMNNPKIPKDEVMNEPTMPTMETLDDYDTNTGSYRY